MTTPTAVIVNDSALVAEGLQAMLAPFAHRIEVVETRIGEFPDVAADIILIDAFGHPDAGLQRLAEAKKGQFGKVVLMAWRITDDWAARAIEAGADGILSKSSDAESLVRSLERVLSGEIVQSDFRENGHSSHFATESEELQLTPREIELLSLVANGLTNREIGAVMFIAESSAKTYLKRVYKKINVTNRSQATLKAVELGLVGPSAEYLG